MPNYNFIQLDVFTDRAFCGNPLAVFPEAEGLSDERMQQIAREMNLSETVFVLPSEKEAVLRRLRIFTPSSELPFAGHPVVGTWNCLARGGVVPLPENGNGWVSIKHEVGIGVLPVDIEFKEGEPGRVVMTQGKFEIRGEIEDWHEQAEIARALGLAREDLDETLPIQAVSCIHARDDRNRRSARPRAIFHRTEYRRRSGHRQRGRTIGRLPGLS